MSEQARSVGLLLLVTLSIFLTYQLWFGRKPEDRIIENDYDNVYFEEPRPLNQLLMPERIFIYQGNLCYQVRPDDPDFTLFWEGVSKILQEITEPANYEYGERLPDDAKLCLDLIFNPALPLGWESPWFKNSPAGELEGVQIWRLDDRFWGVLQDKEGSAGLLLLPARGGLQMAELCDQFNPGVRLTYEKLEAGEIYLTQGTVIAVPSSFYVPADNPQMEELAMKMEILDRELLLNTIFIKRSLVREIKERGGGLIYTDGEQGLRLGNGLEYSHPRLEQKPVILSYTSALMTAGKLLGYYGGWPENLRLEHLARDDGTGAGPAGTYRARWRSYYKGYPLLGGAGVTMIFHQGGLVSYRRNLYLLLYPSSEQVYARDYLEALAAAVDLLAGAGSEHYCLEEMDLAYYLAGDSPQLQAVPVWSIRLNGRQLILKAGDLISLEDSES